MERGKFYNRRYRITEINKERQLYIGTYSRIDYIDHLTKKNPHEIQVLELLALTHDSFHVYIVGCCS